MSFPQGIAFRATVGFVTDAATDSYESGNSGTANYPRTTAQGNTVGWETVGGGFLSTRDRSATIPRLAGKNFNNGTDIDVYRIDLPSSGNYSVNLAAGDAVYSGNTKAELFDTTTSLGVLCSGNTGAGNSFKDAANNIRTAANWVSTSTNGGTAVAATFASTICRLKVGDGSGSCDIAYFYIEAAGGGGGAASSTGSSTTTGAGAATAATPFTVTGASTVVMVGAQAPSGSAASSAGTSNVMGAGAALNAAVISAIGTSVASAAGGAIAAGSAFSAGTSTTQFEGSVFTGIVAGAFSIAGVSTVAFAGAAKAASSAYAAGQATARFVGRNGAARINRNIIDGRAHIRRRQIEQGGRDLRDVLAIIELLESGQFKEAA